MHFEELYDIMNMLNYPISFNDIIYFFFLKTIVILKKKSKNFKKFSQ